MDGGGTRTTLFYSSVFKNCPAAAERLLQRLKAFGV